jgi:hypothetical protein
VQAAQSASGAGDRRGRELRPSPDSESIAIKTIAIKPFRSRPFPILERIPRSVVFFESPLSKGLVSMISGTYLRRQADILIGMSRATFDLTIAGRLRRMAAELQDKAAQEDDPLPISPSSSRAAGADVPASADRLYLLRP